MKANKLDVTGREILVGDTLKATFYNGEPYKAVLKVVIDPADNQVCLMLLEGNEKAMLSCKSYSYLAFGSEKDGKLRKGKIINR